MSKARPVVAVLYDFDGTLAPGNMQEHAFIPDIGMKAKDFWEESNRLARENEMDGILAYMYFMLHKAKAMDKRITREAFVNYGRNVELFPGVSDFFTRMNSYGSERGLEIQHYIISSGLKELIEGTSIAGAFKNIFASYFYYDVNGTAVWPAVALNYTSKTQFLFRINKGCLDIWDGKSVNQYMTEEQRPVKFRNMIYLGDGDTDIPCMKLVKSNGGHSIAVYKPGSSRKDANRLIDENRVDFVAPADYNENKEIDAIVRTIIDQIAAEEKLSEYNLAAKRKTDQKDFIPSK